MSKYTERNLKKHAVFRWNQDMQKFIVYPLSWGFFHVKEWSLLNVNRSFWIIYWNPVPGAKVTCDGMDFEPDPGKVYLFPPHTRFTGKAYNHSFSLLFIFMRRHRLTEWSIKCWNSLRKI